MNISTGYKSSRFSVRASMVLLSLASAMVVSLPAAAVETSQEFRAEETYSLWSLLNPGFRESLSKYGDTHKEAAKAICNAMGPAWAVVNLKTNYWAFYRGKGQVRTTYNCRKL